MVNHNKACRDTMQGHGFMGALVHAGLKPCAWTCTALQGTDRAGDAGTQRNWRKHDLLFCRLACLG